MCSELHVICSVRERRQNVPISAAVSGFWADAGVSLVFSALIRVTWKCPLTSGLNQKRNTPKEGGEGRPSFFCERSGLPAGRDVSPLPLHGTVPAVDIDIFLILFILIFWRQNSSSRLLTVLKVCCVDNSKTISWTFCKKTKTFFRLFFPFLIWLFLVFAFLHTLCVFLNTVFGG